VRDRERADAELRSLNLRLERHVAERTAELDAAVSDLEAFTYSVSHDLRSPLGAVVNFAGILKEDLGAKLDDEGREHLQRLTASALSALAMMDGLAALSKLGRARPLMERVDVAALAREVFDEAVVASARSGAELRLCELPIARADASMLRTVLTNLFTNALKFAAPGRPLEVEVGGRRAEGAEAVYWVRDNGVGFDPRFSERLFRVFERLHAEAGYSGTGIGLAVVARVVRFHGGRVWAEGEPDRGARFCFTLPAERE
jgi:light-regulated signal transduction histidine kinase (bacteriophytochrome)